VLTVTEALAEIKTIDKRIAKKREFILSYLYRQEQLRDPLASQGGSAEVLRQERQSIHDLEERKVAIRRAIAAANADTILTVEGETRSMADWLVWRREVAPALQQFYGAMRDKINAVRQEAARHQVVMVAAEASAKPGDIIVNVDEKQVQESIDTLECTLGALDGALSLKNATTTIDV